MCIRAILRGALIHQVRYLVLPLSLNFGRRRRPEKVLDLQLYAPSQLRRLLLLSLIWLRRAAFDVAVNDEDNKGHKKWRENTKWNQPRHCEL